MKAFGLAVLLSCLAPIRVYALGLGGLDVVSALDQPLEARIPITGASASDLDSLSARLAGPESFRKAGIDRTPYLLTLRFELETADRSRPYLRVFSDKPVTEPALDFLVELRAPSGTIVRHYSALFDPAGPER